MKKNIITLVIVSALFIGCAGVVGAVSDTESLSPKVQQLVEYVNNNQHSMAEDVLKSMSAKEKDEFIGYIEKDSANVPPLYYIKMSDYILKSNKDKAAQWYYIGKVRAYEDIMMCKDKTAQSQLDVLQFFAPKTIKYLFSKNSDKAYMANLLQNVLDWDVNHPNRVNPVWACYQGMSAYSKTPEVKPENQQQQIIANVRDELRESIIKYQNKP